MKKYSASLLLGLLTAVFTASSVNAQLDQCQSPYLHIPSDSSDVEQLPLKHTEVRAMIYGQIAEVRVTQEYENTGKQAIEAIYVFPASTRAAVHRLTMEVGSKCVEAKIMEKSAAKDTYDKATAEGKSAALLEQDRPNVFTMNVSNILPGDKVKLVMTYTENLIPEDGVYEFMYPTAMTPRYTGESGVGSESTEHAAQPFVGEGGPAPTTFDFDARLMTQIPVSMVDCKTHDVDVDDLGKGVMGIDLSADEITKANKDFVLEFKLQGGEIQSGLALHEGEEENYFMLTIEPPARVAKNERPPQELIFIVDVSGSMNGFPNDMCKRLMDELLTNLSPDDVFNVQTFAGGSRLLFNESKKATKENIAQAIADFRNTRAGGGTNMLGALNKALTLKPKANYARTFLILTDGGISVERECYELIRTQRGDANFFTMGIGCAPNHYLLEGMAKVGAGESAYCFKLEDAEAKAEEFKLKATSPVLTDVKIDFVGLEVYDVYPEKPFDLFANKPVTIMGKYKGEPSGFAVMNGNRGSEIYQSTYDLEKQEFTDAGEAIRLCWAREKIREISDFQSVTGLQGQKQDLIDLGIEHNLLTQFTSFVAVDPEVRNPSGNAITVNQPQPLPEGVSELSLSTYNSYGHVGTRQTQALGFAMPAAKMKVMSYDMSTINACEIAVVDELEISEDVFEEFEETTAVFTIVEKEAAYPGGNDQLIKDVTDQIEYPLWAKKSGLEGTVYVSFVVNANGDISNIKIVRGLHDDLDLLVLKAFQNLKKFTPGEQRGKPVRVKMTMPVRFTLKSDEVILETE